MENQIETPSASPSRAGGVTSPVATADGIRGQQWLESLRGDANGRSTRAFATSSKSPSPERRAKQSALAQYRQPAAARTAAFQHQPAEGGLHRGRTRTADNSADERARRPTPPHSRSSTKWRWDEQVACCSGWCWCCARESVIAVHTAHSIIPPTQVSLREAAEAASAKAATACAAAEAARDDAERALRPAVEELADQIERGAVERERFAVERSSLELELSRQQDRVEDLETQVKP